MDFAPLFNQLGNEIIVGPSENDTLRGNSNGNVFIGGQGDDLIVGVAGKNVYILALGDGNDTINDFERLKNIEAGGGILRIKEGADPSNAEISRAGNDLILVIGETGERLICRQSASYEAYFRINAA